MKIAWRSVENDNGDLRNMEECEESDRTQPREPQLTEQLKEDDLESAESTDTYERVEVVSTRLKHNAHLFSARVLEIRREKPNIGSGEWLFLIANRLYYSRAYSILYFTMIFVNVIVLIWLTATGLYAQTHVLLAFEIVTTLILAVEILVKMVTQMTSYWSRPSNWFDFFVLMLCAVSIVIFENSKSFSEAEYVDEMMQSFLIITRYLVQALRLCVLLKQQRRMAELTAGIGQNFVEDIDFSMIDPEIDPSPSKSRFARKERQVSEHSHSSTSSWGSGEGLYLRKLCLQETFNLEDSCDGNASQAQLAQT